MYLKTKITFNEHLSVFREKKIDLIYNMYSVCYTKPWHIYTVCSLDVRKCTNRNKNNKCSSVLLLQPRLDKNVHIMGEKVIRLATGTV